MLKPGFVAAGDEILGMDAAFLQCDIDVEHHPAALADQRHRPLPERQRAVFGQGDQAALGADVAHAVGAGDGQPGFGDHCGEFTAKRGGLRIERLTEARGEHRGAARAGRGAAAQQFRHGRRRHHDHEMVGRLGQRGEVRIAGRVENFRPPRIDQIDRAGKSVALEIAPRPRRPASRPVAHADHHRIARFGQCRDFSF